MFGGMPVLNEKEKERKEKEVNMTVVKYFVYCAALRGMYYAAPYLLEALGVEE